MTKKYFYFNAYIPSPTHENMYPLTFFLSIRPSPGLLPVLGPLERYMTPTLDVALLSSSRAGADLGRTSDVESDILTANV